jgi:hypothetical protein
MVIEQREMHQEKALTPIIFKWDTGTNVTSESRANLSKRRSGRYSIDESTENDLRECALISLGRRAISSGIAAVDACWSIGFWSAIRAIFYWDNDRKFQIHKSVYIIDHSDG